MSEDKKPELPEIPPPPQEQINKLICADYLESIAKMIRSGSMVGFNIGWDTRYSKPYGETTLGAGNLYGPLELKMLDQMAEEQATEAVNSISVDDVSEKIKDHPTCKTPGCLVCDNRKNTLKS